MVKGSRFVRCARVHPSSTVAIDVTRYIKWSTYIKKLVAEALQSHYYIPRCWNLPAEGFGPRAGPFPGSSTCTDAKEAGTSRNLPLEAKHRWPKTRISILQNQKEFRSVQYIITKAVDVLSIRRVRARLSKLQRFLGARTLGKLSPIEAGEDMRKCDCQ